MAAAESSPGDFMNQSWSAWERATQPSNPTDPYVAAKPAKQDEESDNMRMSTHDMSLFGLCPAQDQCYLVVCEACGQVVKPQALKKHMEQRHNIRTEAISREGRRRSDFELSPPVPSSSPDAFGGQGDSVSMANSDYRLPSLDEKASDSYVCDRDEHRPVSSNSGGVHPHGISQHPSGDHRPKSASDFRHLTSATSAILDVPQPFVKMKKIIPPSDLGSPINNKNKKSKVAVPGKISKKKYATLHAKKTSSGVPTSVMKIQADDGGGWTGKNDSESVDRVKGTVGSKGHIMDSDGIPLGQTMTMPKMPKLLPCKDREYDADKHCGVMLPESNLPCTRSLTCKSHSLSMRRSVLGRSQSFDKLLQEHRARKEEILRARGQHQALHGGKKNAAKHETGHKKEKPKPGGRPSKQIPLPVRQVPPQQGPHDVTKGSPYEEPSPAPEYQSDVSSEGEEDTDNASSYLSTLNHHPRPIAMNAFGARRYADGCHAFDRKMDALRCAFKTAVDRYIHPPPQKKLCVADHLASVSAASHTSDPYEFTNLDNGTILLQQPVPLGSHINVASSKPIRPKSKSSKTKTDKNGVTGVVGSNLGGVKRKRGKGQGQSTTEQSNERTSGVTTTGFPVSLGSTGLTFNHPLAGPIPITFQPVMTTPVIQGGHNLTTLTIQKSGLGLQQPDIKDLSIVVTNIDSSLNNGQLVNANLLTSAEGIPIQLVASNHGTANLTFGHGGTDGNSNYQQPAGTTVLNNDGSTARAANYKHFPSSARPIRNANGHREISTNTQLQGNFLPSRLNTVAATTGVYPSSRSSPCPTPSPQFRASSHCLTPSPQFRAGSVSPHLSASSPPIVNGYGVLPLIETSRTPSPSSSDLSPSNGGQYTRILSKPCQPTPSHAVTYRMTGLASHQRLLPTGQGQKYAPSHQGAYTDYPGASQGTHRKNSTKSAKVPLSLTIPVASSGVTHVGPGVGRPRGSKSSHKQTKKHVVSSSVT